MLEFWHVKAFDETTMAYETYATDCLTQLNDQVTNIKDMIAHHLKPTNGNALAVFLSGKRPDWAQYPYFKIVQLNLLYDCASFEKLIDSSHLLHLWVDMVAHLVRSANQHADMLHGVKLTLGAKNVNQKRVRIEYWFEPEVQLVTAGRDKLDARAALEQLLQRHCGIIKKTYQCKKSVVGPVMLLPLLLPMDAYTITRTADSTGKWVDED